MAAERVTQDEYEVLISNLAQSGVGRDDAIAAIDAEGIQVGDRFGANIQFPMIGNPFGDGAVSRVGQSLLGGTMKLGADLAGFAGQAAEFLDIPFIGENTRKALDSLSSVRGAGEGVVAAAREGTSGPTRAAVNVANVVGANIDLPVESLAVRPLMKALKLNKAVKNSIAAARAGKIDDAAKTLDEIIPTKMVSEADDLASRVPEPGLGDLDTNRILIGKDGKPDTILQEVSDSVAKAASATKGAPASQPKLFIDNFKSFGKNLAHQMYYNRSAAEVSGARRELLFKKLIKDPELREDMTFMIQDTGNPLRTDPLEQTAEALRRRIAAHPDGDLALEVARRFKVSMQQNLEELNKLRTKIGSAELDPIDNYVRQMWKLDGSTGQSKLASMDSSEKMRVLQSYDEGIRRGLEPRTTDLAEIWHLTERNLGRTMAMKKAMSDLGDFANFTLDDGVQGLKRIKSGQIVGDDYEVITNPILNQVMVGGEAGELAQSGSKIAIHRELAQPMRSLLSAKSHDEFANKLSKFVSLMKRFNFGFSMFHAYSLSESAINALGPVRGTKEILKLAAKGGGYPAPKRFFDDLPGGADALDELYKPSLLRDDEARALSHGVTVGAPQTDLMRSAWEDAVNFEAKNLATKGLKKAVVDPYASIQRSFDVGLWDRYHHPMKVQSFNILFDEMLRLKNVGPKGGKLRPFKHNLANKLKDMSDEDIGRELGKFVNDEFGGQAWELFSGKMAQKLADPNGTPMKFFRNVFLSPDWNVSSIRAGTAFTSMFGGDAVRGTMGIRHWRNALAGSFVYANAINFAMTKAATGEGKFIWENKTGTPLDEKVWKIDTGFKDEKGKKIYLRWGKQYQELLTLGEHLPGGSFAFRKMVPLWQNIPNLNPTMQDPFSHIGKARREALREARELGVLEGSAAFGRDMIESALPFNVQSFSDINTGNTALDAGLAMVPLPKSKGISLFRGERLMAQAFLEEGGEQKVIAIKNALHENGFTLKEIARTAKSARAKANKRRKRNASQ